MAIAGLSAGLALTVPAAAWSLDLKCTYVGFEENVNMEGFKSGTDYYRIEGAQMLQWSAQYKLWRDLCGYRQSTCEITDTRYIARIFRSTEDHDKTFIDRLTGEYYVMSRQAQTPSMYRTRSGVCELADTLPG